MPTTTHRPIHEIAADIHDAWPKPYFGAVPYLEAMVSLATIDDSYYQDDARSILIYFISNASTFRGPVAKALKLELKQIAGIK